MLKLSQIEEMIRPAVESKGAFVVDVAVRTEGSAKTLEVFADTNEGITTSLCAEISREISQNPDLDKLFHGRYYLVVSSPGLDRPLKHDRQYQRNVGRNIVVQYRESENVRRLEGELVAVGDHDIIVHAQNDSEHRIAFSSIIETRVTTAW
jgi:ribosome maturation factor RimP